ncbi:hypothetical protein [Tomitella cavernea]|uniref:Uncharacterized protein n=1 Tax=Tomitella cavernea TaxID=1387982 RepID=A0ABP9CUL8_9ACTN|nr:hypothetical protein [Tomitella cavernea]
MSRKTLTRIAAASASAALIATGMSVAVGTGVASADATSCNATESFKGGEVTAQQTVTPATAYPGQEVTYSTRISRNSGGWNLKEIGIAAPDGFVLQDGARVNVWTLGSGQTWYNADLDTDSQKNLYWERTDVTWEMNSSHYVELETTFKVPADAEVGSTQQAGVQARPVGWDSQEWLDTGACLKIREKNPVEATQGSLEKLGFGSVNSGSSQVFGSLTDPQGSISGILSDVLGNVLGDMIGS